MTTEEKKPKVANWKNPHTDYMIQQFRAFGNSNGREGWNPNADSNTRKSYFAKLHADKTGGTIFHRKDVGEEKFIKHFNLKRGLYATMKSKDKPENRRSGQAQTEFRQAAQAHTEDTTSDDVLDSPGSEGYEPHPPSEKKENG